MREMKTQLNQFNRGLALIDFRTTDWCPELNVYKKGKGNYMSLVKKLVAHKKS